MGTEKPFRRHRMDQIAYEPQMGEINLTEEMISALRGLPIEEQAKKFAVIDSESTEEYSYGESEGGRHSSSTIDAERCYYADKWIVKDGMIVGIVFRNYANKPTPTFLNESCCTYFCMDDDGVGSTEASVYCKLVWRG